MVIMASSAADQIDCAATLDDSNRDVCEAEAITLNQQQWIAELESQCIASMRD